MTKVLRTLKATIIRSVTEVVTIQRFYFSDQSDKESLLLKLVVFRIDLGLGENGLVFPETVGGFELHFGLGVLPFVVGFLDPGFEELAMAF